MSQAWGQSNETGRFIRLHGPRLPHPLNAAVKPKPHDPTLRLNALEEVPYALGLIRQTLERQLEGDS